MKCKGLFALLTLGFVLLLSSCKKLNEPTELGNELLPAVDNVNTFDTTLNVLASYHPFFDTSKNLLSDNMALGQLHDPVFGNTTADMYFNLSSSTYGSSPFYNKDSILGIDSVVLSLAYTGAYGDTTGSMINVAVSEINSDNGFNDTTLYRYDQLGFTTGPVLGTKSFTVPSLHDSITLIHTTDTTKVADVLRIRLNNSLGAKLSQYDTTGTGPYSNDSSFRVAFRGLAVKATSVSGLGALAYFSLTNANTSLTVYYRVTKNGVPDTASANFVHSTNSQANSVMRTAGGDYLANLNTPSPQKLYIQSSPSGSYAGIVIPELSNFANENKVINRAELIVYKVPSASDDVFTAPTRLLLDHKSDNDSAYIFDQDIQPDVTGALTNLTNFGGTLRSDNSYRFNITRYVQGIVTKKERDDSLRLYAPLRSVLYSTILKQNISIGNLSNIADGRVVLAAPDYPDPTLRMRLRIIYSKL